MTRWRRITSGVAVAVASLGLAVAIALHIVTDPQRLRSEVRDRAREAWSREITIGDISLHLLPLPSVQARDITLVDAPGDKNPWHLHATQVVVGLQFWPLLTGKARPRNVEMDADIRHSGHRVKVVAALDDISQFGQPDAVSNGRVDLDWGQTHVTLSGRIPLQREFRGSAASARLESQALNDMLGFLDIERPRITAPVRASVEVRSAGSHIELVNLDVRLGQQNATGSARISTSQPTPLIDARLQIVHLDWAQAMLDTGGARFEPLPPDELFYDRPLAWPLLLGLEGKEGTIDAELGMLRLRNGVELQHVKVNMAFQGDKLQVKSFTTNLLGGSAKGTMQFNGRKKEVHVNVEGTSLLLERWFKERHREIPFTGGPMAITASITSIGNSMRDLAKSMTGPVKIRMGPGVYASQKAGDAEAMMVAFSKKDSAGRISFECAGAQLPFQQGRATGDGIGGARSDVSRLLTSGYVSMRDEAVDLRGRVQPKPGLGVGLAAIAGDIRIAGKMRALKTTLDPGAKPAVVARTGAAILTLGLSLAGKAVVNATRKDSDPCEVVFGKSPA